MWGAFVRRTTPLLERLAFVACLVGERARQFALRGRIAIRYCPAFATLSSRGPGHRPFTAVTRVRIPLGSLPYESRHVSCSCITDSHNKSTDFHQCWRMLGRPPIQLLPRFPR